MLVPEFRALLHLGVADAERVERGPAEPTPLATHANEGAADKVPSLVRRAEMTITSYRTVLLVNLCPDPIYVAMRFTASGKWIQTVGWWRVPGNEIKETGVHITGQTAWLYAFSDEHQWPKQNAVSGHTLLPIWEKSFRYDGADPDWAEGEREVYFFVRDLDSNENLIQTFSCNEFSDLKIP